MGTDPTLLAYWPPEMLGKGPSLFTSGTEHHRRGEGQEGEGMGSRDLNHLLPPSTFLGQRSKFWKDAKRDLAGH